MGVNPNPNLKPTTLAAAAGGLGALAASCGKLAGLAPPGLWGLMLHIGLWGLLLLTNGYATTCFLASMRSLPSLHATVFSLTANIILTGVIGWAAWGENLNASWLLGG